MSTLDIHAVVKQYCDHQLTLLSIRPALKKLEDYMLNPPQYASSSVSKAYKPVLKKIEALSKSLDTIEHSDELSLLLASLKTTAPASRADSPIDSLMCGAEGDTKSGAVDDTPPMSWVSKQDTNLVAAASSGPSTYQDHTSMNVLSPVSEVADISVYISAVNTGYVSMITTALAHMDDLQRSMHRLATNPGPGLAMDLAQLRFKEFYASWCAAFFRVWFGLGGNDVWSAM